MAGKSEARRNRKLAGIACLILLLGIGGARSTVLPGHGCAGGLLSVEAAEETPSEEAARDACGTPAEGDARDAKETPGAEFQARKDQGIPLENDLLGGVSGKDKAGRGKNAGGNNTGGGAEPASGADLAGRAALASNANLASDADLASGADLRPGQRAVLRTARPASAPVIFRSDMRNKIFYPESGGEGTARLTASGVLSLILAAMLLRIWAGE